MDALTCAESSLRLYLEDPKYVIWRTSPALLSFLFLHSLFSPFRLHIT